MEKSYPQNSVTLSPIISLNTPTEPFYLSLTSPSPNFMNQYEYLSPNYSRNLSDNSTNSSDNSTITSSSPYIKVHIDAGAAMTGITR